MKLICMTFNGDFQRESPRFNTKEEAWDYANDLGSKWWFFPFFFLVTDSEKTVVEAPDGLSRFNGKRVRTVQKIFKQAAVLPQLQDADPNEFSIVVGNMQ